VVIGLRPLFQGLRSAPKLPTASSVSALPRVSPKFPGELTGSRPFPRIVRVCYIHADASVYIITLSDAVRAGIHLGAASERWPFRERSICQSGDSV